MANQDNTRHAEIPRHKGRWLAGYGSPHPGGGARKGFASWRTRVEALDVEFPEFKDLGRYFELDIQGNPQPTGAFARTNPYDAAIIWQKILAVFAHPKYAQVARETFWDRYEGKPTQTIQVSGFGQRLADLPSNFEDDDAAMKAFEEMTRTHAL